METKTVTINEDKIIIPDTLISENETLNPVSEIINEQPKEILSKQSSIESFNLNETESDDSIYETDSEESMTIIKNYENPCFENFIIKPIVQIIKIILDCKFLI